jgi:hypothetical protein
MGRDLLNLSQFILFIIFLIELIIAIKLIKIKTVAAPFKYFWLYPLVGIVISSVALLATCKLIDRTISHPVNAISLLFHYGFISYIFFKVNGNKAVFKWIAIFLFIVIGIFVKIDLTNSNITSFSIANGALFVYALYFITRHLFANTVINLSKDPFFFICTGILVGTVFIVPISFMLKYLREIKTAMNTISYFACISSIGYILINLFFIKALLVARKNTITIEQNKNL